MSFDCSAVRSSNSWLMVVEFKRRTAKLHCTTMGESEKSAESCVPNYMNNLFLRSHMYIWSVVFSVSLTQVFLNTCTPAIKAPGTEELPQCGILLGSFSFYSRLPEFSIDSHFSAFISILYSKRFYLTSWH